MAASGDSSGIVVLLVGIAAAAAAAAREGTEEVEDVETRPARPHARKQSQFALLPEGVLLRHANRRAQLGAVAEAALWRRRGSYEDTQLFPYSNGGTGGGNAAT